MLGGRDAFSPAVLPVGIDNRGGAQQSVEHLFAHGFKRIAHICGPMNHQGAIDRLEGYRDTVGQHGVPYRGELVIEGDWS